MTETDIPFRELLKSFAHQANTFKETRDLRGYCLFWEQGCGKTKTTCDTAVWQFLSGKIDVLLVIAPAGVHESWVRDEIPAHVGIPHIAEFFTTAQLKAQKHQARAKRALHAREQQKLGIITLPWDSLITDAGRELVKHILHQRRAMLVFDEATRMKNPSSRRGKAALNFSALAAAVRPLTGTPTPQSPFDVYAPVEAAAPGFWRREIGVANYFAFKHYFGVFTRRKLGASGPAFDELQEYRNLEQLRDLLKKVSSRVTKASALDLPPKIFKKVYVPLSPEQERAYAILREQLLVELREGAIIPAPLAITRLLLFQEIVCGYVKDPVTKEVVPYPHNRLNALLDLVEDVPVKTIVWARFTQDIENICHGLAIKQPKVKVVRYDGSTSHPARRHAIDQFQHTPLDQGGAQIFVANPAAAGEGLTLHAATRVIYYSNGFKLSERLQSEDRAHRIGQHHPVTYIDLITPGTVDERIVQALREKRDVSNVVTGDNITEWI